MRKRGFTLVEILIVIVIIGILIGALVPRMQSAQGRARDVARKNDLAQLQSAILVSFQDKGEWPNQTDAYSDAVAVNSLEDELLAAGMNGVPSDPLKASTFEGLGSEVSTAGQYMYMVVDSYGSKQGGFILMAKTEVEGGSNRVACETAGDSTLKCEDISGMTEDTCNGEGHTTCTWKEGKCTGTYIVNNADSNGQIKITGDGENAKHPDIRNIKPCSKLEKDSSLNDTCVNNADGGGCKYGNESQLRYILIN